jgi:Flp pilus assembly protein TadG
MTRRSLKFLKSFSLKTFWRDRRGVTAIEFALIAPVLILMYCGFAETTQAMMAQRRLSNITSQIGDLVAQGTQTGPLKMNDNFAIGNLIMAPYPTATLKMCIYSVTSDVNGKDTVAWVQTNPAGVGMTGCPKAGATVTDIPVGALPASQSVIVSKASYDYASPIKLVMPTTMTFKRTFYLRPRRTDAVAWITTL